MHVNVMQLLKIDSTERHICELSGVHINSAETLGCQAACQCFKKLNVISKSAGDSYTALCAPKSELHDM